MSQAEYRRGTAQGGSRAAAADREETDRLEPRHRRRPARRPRDRQPPVPRVDLTPAIRRRRLVPPGNENGNVANSEDRAVRRGGDRSPQSRGRPRKRRSSAPGSPASSPASTPPRAAAHWRPAGRAGAAGRAADHRLCERVREFGEARRRRRQVGAQERPQADRSSTWPISIWRRSPIRQAARFHRRHLGRGRAAGARHARL